MRIACGSNCAFAWTFLYKRYAGLVIRQLERVANARDLLNEVFRRALEKRGSYDERRASFKAWLLGIAYNVALEEIRRRRRVLVPFDTQLPYPLVDESRDPEEYAQENEDVVRWMRRRRWLYRTLDGLPAKQAEAFRLCDLGGLSAKEAADLIEAKPAYVDVLRSRARERLRELASREEDDA